jgi:hypothetical protein
MIKLNLINSTFNVYKLWVLCFIVHLVYNKINKYVYRRLSGLVAFQIILSWYVYSTYVYSLNFVIFA